jgi:activator of HSP90 ATPase
MLFGGTIVGEYISLEEAKRIEMKWKFKEWPEYGNCVITFTSMGNAITDVVVKITGIPEHDSHGNFIHLDTIVNGWKSNIFKRIH